MNKKWLGGFLLGVVSLASAQNAVHEHGAADLRIATEGETLLIEFSGALDNAVGFEHAPRTEVERDTFTHAVSVLEQTDDLFQLPDAAQCKLAEKQIDMPYRDGGGEQQQEHADFQASYQFECAASTKLDEMKVDIFDMFPRIRTIRAVVVTPEAQNSVSLDRTARKLRL